MPINQCFPTVNLSASLIHKRQNIMMLHGLVKKKKMYVCIVWIWHEVFINFNYNLKKTHITYITYYN